MSRHVFFFLGLLAVFGAAVGAGICADDTIAEGRSLFMANCQICHGADGRGNGPAAAALHPKPVDFRQKDFWKSRSDASIAATILHGKSPMPAFDFKSSQVKAIIDYLRHAFEPKPAS